MNNIEIYICSLFTAIALWILSLYFKDNTIDDKMRIALNEEKSKAENLYYNELAVNHPLVIMNSNSSLIHLKKKQNKLVLK
jgi:low temperature requirement protein LtrA